jgi:Fe-S cluster biogenesis protein NfuA
MFIQIETTPNPMSLKFIPGVPVKAGEPINFSNANACDSSPLAKVIFSIKNVSNVFLGADFITVTKADKSNWDLLKPEILVTIMDHFVAKSPVMLEVGQGAVVSEEDDDIIKQIKELIETRVRPAVAQDGGDIVFRGFKDGVVLLELHGACAGCPSSSVTLKNGVESMLKHYVPEVLAVEAI